MVRLVAKFMIFWLLAWVPLQGIAAPACDLGDLVATTPTHDGCHDHAVDSGAPAGEDTAAAGDPCGPCPLCNALPKPLAGETAVPFRAIHGRPTPIVGTDLFHPEQPQRPPRFTA